MDAVIFDVENKEKGAPESVEEPPPPYSNFTKDDLKLQMISGTESEGTNRKIKKKDDLATSWLRDMQQTCYAGEFCPLTCGLIPARPAAWVLALVYIVFHVVFIVMLRAPGVQPEVRGGFTIFAAIHAICMTLAFIGICRKRSPLIVPFIIVQYIEATLLTLVIVIGFCVPVLNIGWCLVSGAGDPFGMFTETWAIAFTTSTLFTIANHLFLAVFIRAAMACSDSRREY